MRELPVHAIGALLPAKGPLAVFLPCEKRRGAALLRIYNVARALRPLGWRTLILPPELTLRQRRRFLARLDPDVVVMQGARHALNRPSFYPGLPMVFDMDDADFHLAHLADPVRRAMPQVDAVIAGSRYVADWCRSAGAGEVHVIWTGTPVSARRPTPQAGRGLVVAWSQTRPMNYTREADLVRSVVRRVAARHPGTTLRLYDRRPGDDPAFAESFVAPGLTVEWRDSYRYRDYLASFDDVSVGLAPLCPETPFSRGKSFGKVLAYLDSATPVVASDVCEHPVFFTGGTGILARTVEQWSAAVDRLLANPQERQRMADAASAAFQARLSTAEAARRTDRVLRRLTILD